VFYNTKILSPNVQQTTALNVSMKKSIPSIVVGLLGFGIYLPLIPFLYEYLNWNLAIQPKVELCKEFFAFTLCKVLAVLLIYLIELPILLVCFSILAIITVIAKKYIHCKFSWLQVSGTYFLAYYTFYVIGQKSFQVGAITLGSFLYQAVVLSVVVWVWGRLTRLLNTLPSVARRS
jgi:hypothetical protein